MFVLWILLTVVVAGLLAVIAKKAWDAHRNNPGWTLHITPAGVAGVAQPYIKEIIAAAVAIFALFMLVIFFKMYFPTLSEDYAARGGPMFGLVLVAIVVAMAAILTKGTVRSLVIGSYAALIIAAFVLALVPAAVVGKPTPDYAKNVEPAPARTAEVYRDPCDGVAREKQLSSRRTLTSGTSGCLMDWGVEHGGVRLYDKDGKDFGRVITKAHPLGKSDFAAAWWSADGPSATVYVRYTR